MSDSSRGSPYGRFTALAEESPEQNRPTQGDDENDEVLAQAAGTRLRAHSHTPMISTEQTNQPSTPSDSGSGEEPNYNVALDLLPSSPTDEQVEQMKKIFAKQPTPEPTPDPNAPLTPKELLALNTIFKSKTPASTSTSPIQSLAARALHAAAQGVAGYALLPPFQIASATATVTPTASALFSQPKGKSKKASTTACYGYAGRLAHFLLFFV
jgi:hypothetical protein